MAFSSRELEHEYLQARYDQYRPFALMLGIATVFVPMGLWLRDYLNYAQGAWGTLGLRLLMSAGVLAYVAALALRAPRRVALLTAYLGVLIIDVAGSMSWGSVPIHASVGYADYMYLFLLAPLLLLPLSLAEVVAVLVTVCLVPNLQVAFGMTVRFSLPLFNLVMWPACLIAAFSLYQFDLVFRRLFLVQRQVSEQALTDPLTGLGNRRYFDERGNGALALARRRARPLAVLMIDIDHFKRINDRHGHTAGDAVLCALGNVLKASLRGGDFCGRLGGEEFAVVLPEEDSAGGASAAERLRRGLEQMRASSPAVRGPIGVTVSIGVAAYPEDGDSLAALLLRADERLYRAKEGGRNRVVADG